MNMRCNITCLKSWLFFFVFFDALRHYLDRSATLNIAFRRPKVAFIQWFFKAETTWNIFILCNEAKRHRITQQAYRGILGFNSWEVLAGKIWWSNKMFHLPENSKATSLKTFKTMIYRKWKADEYTDDFCRVADEIICLETDSNCLQI